MNNKIAISAYAFAMGTVCTSWLLANENPNVVIVMADDIGFECYGHKGSQFYATPHIDQLAKTGVEFTQAYSQPICTPSRVRIMTGRYNFKNYTRFGELDLTQPTFATLAKTRGYATVIAGKWQLSPGDLDGPHRVGFDEYCLWHFSAAHDKKKQSRLPRVFRNKGSRYKSPRMFQNGELLRDTEGRYGPDLASDFLCDFIDRKRDQPFLIYYPMILTHSPFEPTPDSSDWHARNKKREPIEYFREMVTYMDKLIGKIVAKLEQAGLREKTLILITGDNGTHTKLASPFPSRGMIQGGKGSMKDAGNRVAFVANWPGVIQPGTVVDSPIGFADVLPTVAEIIDANIQHPMDGQSLLPLMKGDASNARGWMFQSYSKGGNGQTPFRCFVRDANWKLYADGSLYHVPHDWQEKSPVTGPAGSEHRKRLQPILDAILRDAKDELIDRGPQANP